MGTLPDSGPLSFSERDKVPDMKCLACLAESDGVGVYPYDDDKMVNDRPIPKLSCIEAQPTLSGEAYKLLILCFECWHKLEGDNGPDMWTSQEYYEELDPKTPFADLPELQYTQTDGSVGGYEEGAIPIWDPEYYQSK